MPVSGPEKPSPNADTDPGFGIYIHWPFCLKKCPYCDFNSHVGGAIDDDRWRRALIRELAHFAQMTGNRRVGSIFFGGGTPSLMAPRTVAALIGRIDDLWPLAADVEITLEANPTSVEAARLEDLRGAGVNRLSLGIQALDDASLGFLGRQHSVDEALAALDVARGLFDRLSFDLIYARPGQDEAAWTAELGRALALATSHLSLYQLTIEPGTAFYARWQHGGLELPDDDVGAGLFEITRELCAGAGLGRYEVSNYAAPGERSRHNLNYWRYGEYAGIGPGAHGRLRWGGALHAVNQTRSPGGWLAAVEAGGHATEQVERLTVSARAEEMLLMGLRLREGVSRWRFAAVVGRPLDDFISIANAATLAREGYLILDDHRIAVTDKGMALLDSLIGLLLLDPEI